VIDANSGLDTDVSDFVSMASVTTPYGLSLTALARLDEKTLEPMRTGASIGYGNDRLQTNLTYTQIAAQPKYAASEESTELQTSASFRLTQYVSVFGSMTWDLNNDVVSRRSAGFSYEDECTIFSLYYTDKRDISNTAANDWQIGARLSFRTLGDIQVGDAPQGNYRY